jgi:hypothetical protein
MSNTAEKFRLCDMPAGFAVLEIVGEVGRAVSVQFMKGMQTRTAELGSFVQFAGVLSSSRLWPYVSA